MLRKLLILLACSGFVSNAYAQAGATAPEGFSIPGTAVIRPAADDPKVKFDYKQKGAPLPKFEIFDQYQDNITQKVIGKSGNLFLMVFNPVCDHCEEQTRLLLKNDSLFKESKLLLIAAPIQVSNLSYFNANTHFSSHTKTVTVTVDSARVLDKIFNYVELPQINIYDGKTKRLLKTFNGIKSIDSLSSYIQ